MNMPFLTKPKVRIKGHLTASQTPRAILRIRRTIAKEISTIKKTKNGQKIIFYKTRKGIIPIKITIGRNGRITAHQQPVTHGITGIKQGAYLDLISILTKGFRGRTQKGSDNAIISTQRLRRGQKMSPELANQKLAGDAYSIETVSKLESIKKGIHLKTAAPSEIISVNIALNPELTKAQAEERKRFYRTEIQQKLKFPVKFVNLEIKP
jgi:hypothetical protein